MEATEAPIVPDVEFDPKDVQINALQNQIRYLNDIGIIKDKKMDVLLGNRQEYRNMLVKSNETVEFWKQESKEYERLLEEKTKQVTDLEEMNDQLERQMIKLRGVLYPNGRIDQIAFMFQQNNQCKQAMEEYIADIQHIYEDQGEVECEACSDVLQSQENFKRKVVRLLVERDERNSNGREPIAPLLGPEPTMHRTSTMME